MAATSNRNGQAPVTTKSPAPAEPTMVDPGRLPQSAIPPRSSGRIQRRYGWAKIPGPYAELGMEILLWENHPHKLWQDVASGVEDRRVGALLELVREHRMLGDNCEMVPWSDDEGDLPQPCEAVYLPVEIEDTSEGAAPGATITIQKRDVPFWARVPGDVGVWIIGELRRLGTSVPNSMTATSTNGLST